MTDSSIHIFEEKAWYFLSIFYAREKWADLISRILHFYTMRKMQFSDFLLSFSEERGEHIRIAFISPNCTENYQNKITDFFQLFVDEHPSVSTKVFPYGKAVWCDYPNNTLVWDRFRIRDYSEEYIRFHQTTFQLALHLLENDFSADSIFSFGIYLFTKGLLCMDADEHKNAIYTTLQDISFTFENYAFNSTVKEVIEQIDANEVNEAIESYMNEEKSNYSPELINWMVDAKYLLKDNNYKNFCFLICKITGLSELRQIMILELLNTWYNNPGNA
jgi:hypothetical protein